AGHPPIGGGVGGGAAGGCPGGCPSGGGGGTCPSGGGGGTCSPSGFTPPMPVVLAAPEAVPDAAPGGGSTLTSSMRPVGVGVGGGGTTPGFAPASTAPSPCTALRLGARGAFTCGAPPAKSPAPEPGPP